MGKHIGFSTVSIAIPAVKAPQLKEANPIILITTGIVTKFRSKCFCPALGQACLGFCTLILALISQTVLPLLFQR